MSNSFDNKHQVDVIYTDFSKAFDKLSNEILLVKLLNIGLSVHLVQLIYSYLSSRFQYVKHYAYESDWISVTSGVPQGSILGPLLFDVFINDIVKDIKAEVLMYADDLKDFPAYFLCKWLSETTRTIYLWIIINAALCQWQIRIIKYLMTIPPPMLLCY